MCAAIVLMASVAMAQDTKPAYIIREEMPSLDVNGVGEVNARPDVCYVHIGAEFQEVRVGPAQEKVNEAMTSATAKIKEVGIEPKDIRTSNISVETIYDREHANENKVVAYRARNTLVVKVTDLTKIPQVIDAAMKAGANAIDGIRFDLLDGAPQRKQALESAARQAQEKAKILADAMDVNLVEKQSITEIDVSVGGGQSLFGGGGGGGSGYDTATPVEAGELVITARVALKYRIAKR